MLCSIENSVIKKKPKLKKKCILSYVVLCKQNFFLWNIEPIKMCKTENY
jgi:hypothetical protein